MKRVLVTGATGLVGRYLLPRLLAADFDVHALTRSRRHSQETSGPTWHALDITQGLAPWGFGDVRYIVHLAPLWLLPPLLEDLAALGAKRLIAFGSTSCFTKQDSRDRRERDWARRLVWAEEALARSCPALGIAWTVFRPTLIYGGGLDRNVTAIARFIRRFHFFPVVGDGRGRRQPVHADDLAASCLLALDVPETYARAYNLTGGSILSYQEMVGVVFDGLGRRQRILHLPLPVLRMLLRCVALLPGYSYVTADMADRMNRDLCFDATEAAQDFGYSPRPFVFAGEADARPPTLIENRLVRGEDARERASR